MKFRVLFSILFFGFIWALPASPARADEPNPALTSEFVREMVDPPGEELDVDVCEEWNPEFVGNGMRCCGYSAAEARRSHKRVRCDAHRNRHSYCGEVTDEEREYTDMVKSGKLGDVLQFLSAQVQHRPIQAYCSVSSGFLVRGRPIVPTAENIIQLRSPERCTNYGTEPMAAMLEWLGRQVKAEFSAEYPGIHLVLGDVTAPRGGCLASAGGRRGHLSHSIGQDADVGFVTPVPKNRPSPDHFHRDLPLKPNFWFLKQVFHNPYACIKMIFLDKRHIAKLARTAGTDPDWLVMRKFIHHVKGHRDHFHIRIGNGPGQPGCASNVDELNNELENEEPEQESDSISGQGSQVE